MGLYLLGDPLTAGADLYNAPYCQSWIAHWSPGSDNKSIVVTVDVPGPTTVVVYLWLTISELEKDARIDTGAQSLTLTVASGPPDTIRYGYLRVTSNASGAGGTCLLIG